jgi:hypothetical protein
LFESLEPHDDRNATATITDATRTLFMVSLLTLMRTESLPG